MPEANIHGHWFRNVPCAGSYVIMKPSAGSFKAASWRVRECTSDFLRVSPDDQPDALVSVPYTDVKVTPPPT